MIVHIQLTKDSYSARDDLNLKKLEIPKTKVFFVRISSIKSIDELYGSIVKFPIFPDLCSDNEDDNANFVDLLVDINENVDELEKLRNRPQVNDIVLAPLPTENSFYRARILEMGRNVCIVSIRIVKFHLIDGDQM